MMRRNHLLYTPYMRGDQATWIIEQSAMERLSIRGWLVMIYLFCLLKIVILAQLGLNNQRVDVI